VGLELNNMLYLIIPLIIFLAIFIDAYIYMGSRMSGGDDEEVE
jgi:hypothetical protein